MPLRARFASVSADGPTVSRPSTGSSTTAYLHVAGDRPRTGRQGRALAVAVVREHRLAEQLLVDIIGLPSRQSVPRRPARSM